MSAVGPLVRLPSGKTCGAEIVNGQHVPHRWGCDCLRCEPRYLFVPARWLEACGAGKVDRAFRVLELQSSYLPSGERATFVTVDKDGHPWVVLKEWRGARFVGPIEYEARLPGTAPGVLTNQTMRELIDAERLEVAP